jgi:hypothetical protein
MHCPRFRMILSVTIGVLTFVICGESVRAGILAGQPTIYGPGSPRGLPMGETVAINNDNVEGSNPNLISLAGIDITGLDPVDLRIPVANSPMTAGTTEYLLSLGTAANLTDAAWKGFVIELGSGVGVDFLRLSAQAISGVSGLDFDTPDRDHAVSSLSFLTITHDADRIAFSGGAVPVGEVASAQNFSLDIPDTTNAADPTYRFTIRLRPIPVVDVEGDFNQDGDVDGRDFLAWQRNPALGSLSDWQANYGPWPSLADSTAVPEPSGAFALVVALAMCGRRRSTLIRMASNPNAQAAK